MADRPATVGDVLTELDKDDVGFILLAELQFADGTINVWFGPENETIDYISKTWTGTGDFAEMERVDEDEALTDKSLVAVLHATIAQIDTIELAANEGRDATFYILLYNLTTGVIIGHIEDPREMGKSWIEPQLVIEKDAKLILSDIKMEFVGEGGIMKRVHVRKLNYTDGLEIDPADHFLEFSGDPDQSDHGGSMSVPTGGGSDARLSDPRDFKIR